MLRKSKRTKITRVGQVSALGVRTGLKRLSGFGNRFTFESPASTAKTTFRGKCKVGYLTYLRGESYVSQASIGRFCAIAPNVFIGGGEHPTDWLSVHNFQCGGGNIFHEKEEFTALIGNRKYPQPGPIEIGNDVWVGQGANISRGVTIGDGAIIASHAVVTKDVAPYTIVGGVPARPIRRRFPDETIERLLALKWWNYDLAPIAKKIDYSDIQKSLDLIEKSISTKTLSPLTPAKHTIFKDKQAFYVK